MKLYIPEYIQSIKPYTPGKPMEELEREYGIRDSIKLASNENPLGPSPMAVKAAAAALQNAHRYPEGSGYYLTRKLSETLNLSPGNIVLGNGSDDVIGMLTKAFLRPGDEAIMPQPSFLMYEILVQSVGAVPVPVPLSSLRIDLFAMVDKVTPKTRMIFLTHPNNPTGTILLEKEFQSFIKRIPEEILLVIDEAYIEFVREPSALNSMKTMGPDSRVVILRTFSKAYGLAGFRVGYGLMAEKLARVLQKIRQPFNVNSLAQAAALAALDDTEFFAKTLKLVHEGLDFMYAALDRMGVSYFPSQANFFLIRVGDADDVYEKLLRKGVIVRSMTSYGFPDTIRLTIGLESENRRFLNALETLL
ncbi:MAG: histidinol-phosphate transaminase [Desulfobacterales bacterium]